jgi:endonuclease/exonuclease/phosphatase family metal-dependent hydrolase
MKIVTCNIRYFGASDGDDDWTHRRALCIDVIRARAPQVICFQEMWREQLEDLAPAFPEFARFGMVDEPTSRHPVNAIFYRNDRFRCLSQGGYWLSETPHITGSRSWDSACVRLANWVRLEEVDSGWDFRVINTHLDHVSQPARESQARLINQDAAAYPVDYPQFLTGDMNCDEGNRAIAIFREGGWWDTYEAVHGTADPGFTYHGFKGPGFESDIGKIDWVFARGTVSVVGAELVTDARGGHFPSDHYFVSAEVER